CTRTYDIYSGSSTFGYW
nr:immunoglobulin heavy chain junction region [Macaca mulatta]MPN70364.1 immunoglobulin heavy chain junction region [Macaca mulatta]MPN71071.1 immunoglobulin heavy chain junction region [Macaca mulatta]MPN71125.1 immunoglobulin heavy chain junction region [Macaca mulatta]MPN71561.1 immunoglobulin heavy chain junction region [Macaca mulatta]